MILTVFANARQLSLSWARSIQSMPPQTNSWRFILLLSSHLCLCLPSGLFPLSFRTKTPYEPLIPPYVLQSHISFFLIRSPKKFWLRNTYYLSPRYVVTLGPGSVVGIESAYGLDGQVIEFRWGEIFRTRPERSWGPPTLLYNGNHVFPGSKAAGAWRLPLTPF